MPAWIYSVFSIVLAFITVGGLASFPLVPQFFGVYGPEGDEWRGWLVTLALLVFPIVSGVCLYQFWTGGAPSYIVFVPYGMLMVLWLIRPNQ